MFKKILLTGLVITGLASGASAAGGGGHVEDVSFSFEGPFGTYDKLQLQRGLKVYTEVCAACHGLRQVAFRTLTSEDGPGFSEEAMKAYAKEFSVFDPELDDERPATPADHFPANTSAGAPDLSLMAKARAGFHGPYGLGLNQFLKGMGGPEYITSLLTGYTGEEKEEAGTTFYENHAFSSGWISMAPPLEDGAVEFDDGHPNDLHHMAEDVSAFLMWAAEPHLNERKQFGFIWVVFLGLVSMLLYLTNKKLWAPIKRKKFEL